jgi:hypothetical protein
VEILNTGKIKVISSLQRIINMIEELRKIHYTEAHPEISGYREWCFGCKAIQEIDRLLSGKFTKEEFQNLCHEDEQSDMKNYPCSPEEFAVGCHLYQKLLFGRSPSYEKIEKLSMSVMAALDELADENLIDCKNILENALAGEGSVGNTRY